MHHAGAKHHEYTDSHKMPVLETALDRMPARGVSEFQRDDQRYGQKKEGAASRCMKCERHIFKACHWPRDLLHHTRPLDHKAAESSQCECATELA